MIRVLKSVHTRGHRGVLKPKCAGRISRRARHWQASPREDGGVTEDKRRIGRMEMKTRVNSGKKKKDRIKKSSNQPNLSSKKVSTISVPSINLPLGYGFPAAGSD
ncbi:uncharacterized protein PGTG_07037 [Puccinia graminis f. sp. tritici CRL 75-36-700-3]|uniref:Uncharacterized protein n=1 Tax=Puccinia graminis f. sp. tritici (strain CRL 75-36-700-3 / race SCCL) TaxID=418459 RepID=E3KAJ9_PUCGT|nr:uncharacterized protein PGTG_07037 [Puccinia graminis f. sp. tritici CRL 75-36-700-3]EFP81416.1 hypothetical protein PGTG_07037 [Puccinia graminis f. sp. tritici CRL 75-36-700-3]